jgi:hypothetical protein
VKRVDATCGVANIFEQCHRLNQLVELIAEHYVSRARADLPSLRFQSLLTLLGGMEKLGGKVGIACGCGGLLHSSDLISY